MESLMQNLIQHLLVPESYTYLLIKVGALLLVLIIWMLVRAKPAY